MCFCVLLPSGRLGPARAEVGLGFALLGWFRRFRPPPPPLVWLRVRRPSLFFFLAFSGFCPFRARCVVLVFALSLFSCVPLFASWLSNFHSIFTFISFSSSSHLPRCGGACVCTIWIDVKLLICRGSPGSRGGRWPTKTPPRDPCKRTCRTPVVHLGAIISRSWWPPESYIYLYIFFISPVRFNCVVFARPMHSTSVIR